MGASYTGSDTARGATLTQSLGLTPESSSQQSNQHFTLEERFSDFKSGDGLVLPRTWQLRYARTGNTTTEWKYDCNVQSVQIGPPVERR
jgi:hypothetical protein